MGCQCPHGLIWFDAAHQLHLTCAAFEKPRRSSKKSMLSRTIPEFRNLVSMAAGISPIGAAQYSAS